MLIHATLSASVQMLQTVHIVQTSKARSTLWCGTQVRNSAIATLNAMSKHLLQLQLENWWISHSVFAVLRTQPLTSQPNASPKVSTRMASSEHAVMYKDYKLVSLPSLASLQTHTQHSAVISHHAQCYLKVALVLMLEKCPLEVTSLQTLSKPNQAR